MGVLKRGVKSPQGKIRKTVQIDDFKVADDGRLILIEAKWGKRGLDVFESPHVKYRGSVQDKIDHLKRLVRFARENKNQINRIEIWANNTGYGANSASTTGEIYANILQHLSPQERAFIQIKWYGR